MNKLHVMASGQQIKISASCEEAVCRLLLERTGIVIRDHQLRGLHDTLTAACQKFNYPDVDSYMQVLSSVDDLSPEFEFLIAGVTIGESYFFRDETQMAFLREVFLPELISRRRAEGKLELRIWSAACSNGQELYSIAIMLHELLPDIHDWKLHLLGTDINISVLSTAMKGRYHEWSMRAVNAWQRQRYFCESGGQIELDAKIRHGVKFAYLNLRDNSYPSILNETHALDLVLCRNVLIYLQQPVITEIIGKLRDSMHDEAILMLGATDTMDIGVPELVIHNHGYAHYYKKAPAAPLVAEAVKPSSLTGLKPSRKQISVRNRAQMANASLHKLSSRLSSAETIRQTPRSLPSSAKMADVQAVIELVTAGEWQKIIDVTATAAGERNSLLLQFRAKALANRGQLQAAVETCELALQMDVTDKHTYFIYGLVLQELKRTEEAESAFNKCLYLDRSFLEAYYQLGLMMIRSGRHKAGLKNLNNAMELAERGEGERGIHDTMGMTYERFAQVLRSEISMYKELG